MIVAHPSPRQAPPAGPPRTAVPPVPAGFARPAADPAGDAVLRELLALRRRIPDTVGTLVATRDGFLVAADLPDGVAADELAALTATELSLSHRVASTVHEGPFEEVVIRSSGGHVAIYAAGANAALAVLTGPDATLGRVHLEARPAARAVAAHLPAARRA